ncbi:MarR family transcriptional regulator [Candidatus Woesearchaeota archaeon]|nr:MarR family transcriptional regulator [Candidatus Woesearchaeota archaeon]
MDMRRVGIILVAVGIALLALTYLFKLQEDKHLEQISIDKGTCFVDGKCVYEERDFILYIVGGFLGAFILFLGVYFLFLDKHSAGNPAEASVVQKEIDTSQLDDEELKVYHYLKEHNGSAYQSELARNLELTKVKVTRILDRLEGFGVLERKRRGMTNVVILRH